MSRQKDSQPPLEQLESEVVEQVIVPAVTSEQIVQEVIDNIIDTVVTSRYLFHKERVR